MIVYTLDKIGIVNNVLARAQVTIWSGTEPISTVRQNFAVQTLERAHGIILEISRPTNELYYLLAQAIILQKPTLCLYIKNRVPRKIITHLSNKNIPKSICAKSYSRATLEHVIKMFLHSLDNSIIVTETPDIKFTLRLTGTMERYLNWLVENKHLNKAIFLRNLLEKTIEQDEEYKQFLDNPQ